MSFCRGTSQELILGSKIPLPQSSGQNTLTNSSFLSLLLDRCSCICFIVFGFATRAIISQQPSLSSCKRSIVMGNHIGGVPLQSLENGMDEERPAKSREYTSGRLTATPSSFRITITHLPLFHSSKYNWYNFTGPFQQIRLALRRDSKGLWC
jgi:hypothetical protein